MRKYFLYVAAAVTFSVSLSSCGLFGGGKSEKCPAYTAVPSGDSADDMALATEKTAE